MRAKNVRVNIRMFFPAVVIAAITIASCAKKGTGDYAAYEGQLEKTAYEIDCITTPTPAPTIDPWTNSFPPEKPLPDTSFPTFSAPIEVKYCDGLNGAPQFFSGTQPGFVAIVDCNSRTVKFRTRDWQILETSGIDPTGAINAKVMYITRLAHDAAGHDNCWSRLLGHVTGHVDCPAGNPAGANLNLHVDWTFDETPPGAMADPDPGLADFRNGQHCELAPGNCLFSNQTSVGCGGGGDNNNGQ